MNRYAEMLDLRGSKAVITGALSGAGEYIAHAFADAGASLILTYNSSGEAAEGFRRRHPDCDAAFLRLDQSDTDSVSDFVSALADRGETIDCLVNNAGIYPAKDILRITPDDWDRMIDTNTKGPFFLSQRLLPLMKRGASIINISSLNATNPSRDLAHYGISKAAVEMMTKNLAQACGDKVRVNCIAPGLIFKEGQDRFIPGWADSYRERSPLHKLVEPDEIARTCLFLASELSSAITGQTIAVDCGIQLAPCFANELREQA